MSRKSVNRCVSIVCPGSPGDYETPILVSSTEIRHRFCWGYTRSICQGIFRCSCLRASAGPSSLLCGLDCVSPQVSKGVMDVAFPHRHLRPIFGSPPDLHALPIPQWPDGTFCHETFDSENCRMLRICPRRGYSCRPRSDGGPPGAIVREALT